MEYYSSSHFPGIGSAMPFDNAVGRLVDQCENLTLAGVKARVKPHLAATGEVCASGRSEKAGSPMRPMFLL
jgi:hypothetical protein